MAKLRFTKDPDFSYADHFDRLMEEHFGEKFSTEWSLFAGSLGGYVTTRENGKRLTKAQVKVGRSISNAMAAGAMEFRP